MKREIVFLIMLIIVGSLVFGAQPTITQLSYEPSPAIPGDIITILVQIENKDNIPKTDVVISLENEYPFIIQEEMQRNIGNLASLGKAQTQFKVYVDPSAQNKTYSIPITIKTKEEPIAKTTNREIIVSGKKPLIKVINISTNKLIPGQEKDITFELQNIGTSSAYDIILELQEDRTITNTGIIVERQITPLGSANTYIEKLNPREKVKSTIQLSVNRNADLKNYTLPVKVSYRDSSGTRTEDTSYIGFKIAGEVIMDLAIKESVILVAGQEETITMELFNKGVGKAEFTIVNLKADFGTINKEKQFIGSLEPNDVDSFKTTIKINPDIETKEGIITATLEYQDTDATIKTKTINVPVKVYSAQEGAVLLGTNPFMGIINIIILIIILIGGWQIYTRFIKK